ncbi:MAG: HlyD family efflux transporter periplasmic adaptor subunit [Magnetococcales bacterium]|nr:HlyD family efflux transporter periplasmic adaptor subunit [Magnetococcales bacterium]
MSGRFGLGGGNPLTAPAPLRTELKIRKLVQRGEVTYVIKEPDKQTYYRFSESQHLMLTLFDGKKEPDVLIRAFDEASEEYEYDLEALMELIASAKNFRLLQRSKEEERAALIEKLKETRKGRFLQAKGSLMNMRFHLHDPSAFFDRILHKIQWLWTTQGVYASLLLIGVALFMVILQFDRFSTDFERVFFFAKQGGWNALSIWMVTLGAIAFHEMGHGLTCRHFGGDVDDMGFLLLAFQPCLYANVNDAWLFENNRHKLYVALAGVWIELVLCAFAVFIWTLTDVETLIGRISFILVTVATASSLFLNLNPLMKFDGYYILSDYLEIPNLRQNAIDWFSYSLKKNLLHLNVTPPFTPDSRERRIYFNYGLLIVVYLTIMMSGLALMGYGALADTYGFWGVIFFMVLLFKLVKMMTGTWLTTMKEWIMKTLFSSPTRRAASASLGLIFLLALFLWQPKVIILTAGKVDAETFAIHAPESGFATHVAYRNDRTLSGQAGEPLFSLQSPEMELELSRLQARLEGMTIDRNAAMSQGNRAKIQHVDIESNSLREQIGGLKKRLGQLSAPIPIGKWQVDGPPPLTLTGRYFARGETVLTLVPMHKRRINVILEQSDLSMVHEGDFARVRIAGAPETIFSATVQTVTPVTKQEGPNRLFQVRLEISIPEGIRPPPSGLNGEVKIEGERAPLWAHLLRPIRATLRTDLWI